MQQLDVQTIDLIPRIGYKFKQIHVEVQNINSKWHPNNLLMHGIDKGEVANSSNCTCVQKSRLV